MMSSLIRNRYILLLALCSAPAWGAPPADLDRDGLPDRLEQKLLERFAPQLILSVDECDAVPAEFAPNQRDPRVASRTGVLYGQAFRNGARIELHYYHLWSRDCGRVAHALDAEHVSALLEGAGEKWQAKYWYAAGHESTVCDRSTAARAVDLEAVKRGPRVWVSAGKHASYLDPQWCSGVCGADRCTPAGLLWRAPRIINLGERGVPLNGATWVASGMWKLQAKLMSDFTPAVLAAAEPGEGPRLVWPALRPAQAVLMGGAEVAVALTGSGRHTSNALEKADQVTTDALAASAVKTGRALRQSARSVARLLGQLKNQAPE
ncbi:MAG: hypothetical protein FJW31_20235 [Acidobacteria bacterium]|nr:hypothetical protein [Acidobacteriota bacterium]